MVGGKIYPELVIRVWRFFSRRSTSSIWHRTDAGLLGTLACTRYQVDASLGMGIVLVSTKYGLGTPCALGCRVVVVISASCFVDNMHSGHVRDCRGFAKYTSCLSFFPGDSGVPTRERLSNCPISFTLRRTVIHGRSSSDFAFRQPWLVFGLNNGASSSVGSRTFSRTALS